VTLPALGESVTEGTVTRWLKQVGDEVAVDEPLLEVSTDKVDTEIPSPVAGTLLEIKVEEDETVEVGAELAVIGRGGAASEERRASQGRSRAGAEPSPSRSRAEEPEPPSRSPRPEPRAAEPEPAQKAAEPAAAPRSRPRRRPRRTSRRWCARWPPARRRPRLVTGTGVGGRIRKQDVLDAAQAEGGSRAARRRRRPARRRPAPAPAARRDAVAAARQDRADLAAAQGDRQADGRVAPGQRPADHVVEVDVTRSRGCAARSRTTSPSARA
jgi:2-oxoglutarate dehydrogenase E2 component (dihydrolipoamide succinyltransferase)